MANEAKLRAEKLAQNPQEDIYANIGKHTKDEAVKSKQSVKDTERRKDAELAVKDSNVTLNELRERVKEIQPEIEYLASNYDDKISEKLIKMIPKLYDQLAKVIPTDDTQKISKVVRKIEKLYMKMGESITRHASEEEVQERQKVIADKMKKQQEIPKDVDDSEIIESLRRYAE